MSTLRFQRQGNPLRGLFDSSYFSQTKKDTHKGCLFLFGGGGGNRSQNPFRVYPRTSSSSIGHFFVLLRSHSEYPTLSASGQPATWFQSPERNHKPKKAAWWRPFLVWWRRRESNPRPKALCHSVLHA